MAGTLETALLAYAGEASIELTVPAFVTNNRAAGGTSFRPAEIPLTLGPGHLPPNPPLVSGLMVTRDRFALARLSVGWFRRQTWPRKELVVLDESMDGGLRDWIASLNDPSVRVVEVPPGSTLGELRNRSIELATGDYVCQWDDDDLQHPARLEIALAAMAATHATTSLLVFEMLWMPRLKRLGVLADKPRPLENTIVTARDPKFRYPALARAEDTPAVEALLHRTQAVLLALPWLYIYAAHGANTWHDRHMESLWENCAERSEGAGTDARLAPYAKIFPVQAYAEALGPATWPPLPT